MPTIRNSAHGVPPKDQSATYPFADAPCDFSKTDGDMAAASFSYVAHIASGRAGRVSGECSARLRPRRGRWALGPGDCGALRSRSLTH